MTKPKKATPTYPLSIRVPPELRKAMEKRAAKDKITISRLVTDAIRQHLETV